MHVCFETKPNSCVHLRECQRLLNAVSVIEAQLWLAAANKNETGLLFELCRVAAKRDLGYLFSGLLALTKPLERTFVLPFSASTAAIRVSALSPSADRRALWVALRWLARRFVSFALFVPRIWSSIDFAKVFSPLQTRKP
jgi:hypothetical protein